jgi:hypothetical protein
MIGFWVIYGAVFSLSLFVQQIPHDFIDQFFYWARLAAGMGCFFIAFGLGWRRAHPN